jgi:hypothetical protein
VDGPGRKKGLTTRSPSISPEGKVTPVWLKAGVVSAVAFFRDESHKEGRGTRRRTTLAGDDCGSIGAQAEVCENSVARV